MLTPYYQPQFLSRVFTDPTGRQFRLTFLVALVNGELKGRLVSAEPLSQNTSYHSISCGTTDNICLPIICSSKTPSTPYIPSFAPVVSPYFSLEFLINSQPTRAPANLS